MTSSAATAPTLVPPTIKVAGAEAVTGADAGSRSEVGAGVGRQEGSQEVIRAKKRVSLTMTTMMTPMIIRVKTRTLQW